MIAGPNSARPPKKSAMASRIGWPMGYFAEPPALVHHHELVGEELPVVGDRVHEAAVLQGLRDE